jgi:thiol-disulfide isomerase/thioredoxin
VRALAIEAKAGPDPMIRRRWIAAALAGAGMLALGGGLVLRQMQDADARVASTRNGSTLLALDLPDPAGKNEPLAQWKGKVIVVNFWATWCEPCRDEMPRFVALQDEYGDKGLQFVGIAVDQVDKVRQFSSDIKLNYPALIGGYGAIELSRSLGNTVGALPFTVVLSRSGEVVHTQLGPVKDPQLRALITQLL